MPLLRWPYDRHRDLRPRRPATAAAATAQDGNLMMLQSQKTDTDRQYRRCLTSHTTVLPNPAPERSHQRQSMLKAETMTPDDLCQGSPTPPPKLQIPIARTNQNAEPKLPVVSSVEACPTPAERGGRWHPPTADVRQPLTERTLANFHTRPRSTSCIHKQAGEYSSNLALAVARGEL